MARALAIGLLAIVVCGCGSSVASPPPGGSTPAPASTRSVGSGHGADDNLCAGVARGDIDTRTDGYAARAPRDVPRRRRSTPPPRRASRPSCDASVARGAPDMIAAVITADGTWAGAAGVDGPKGRKAESTDEFGIAERQQGAARGADPQAGGRGQGRARRTVGDLPRRGRCRRERRNGASGARDALGDRRHARWRDRQGPGRVRSCRGRRTTSLGTVPSPFAAAGTQYEYSNPTYKLVGVAAENASGMPLGDALDSLVLDGAASDRILLQGPHASPPKPWALPLDGHASSVALDAVRDRRQPAVRGLRDPRLGGIR